MLAPRWHTALLVTFLIVVATLGAWLTWRGSSLTAPPPPTSRIVSLYAPTLLVEWGLALYVIRIGRAKSALADLLGTMPAPPSRGLVDLAYAVALFLFIESSEALYAHFSGATASPAVLALLPQTTLERAAWVMLATSIGFCEEIVYRGYLLVQLSSFSRSPAIGVIAQGVLFGVAHGQQGGATALRFIIYGVAFGVVARARGSLLADIGCHVAIDLSSGLLHH